MIISPDITHNQLLCKLKTYNFHNTPDKLREFLKTNENDSNYLGGVYAMLNFAIEAEDYESASIIQEHLNNGRQCNKDRCS